MWKLGQGVFLAGGLLGLTFTGQGQAKGVFSFPVFNQSLLTLPVWAPDFIYIRLQTPHQAACLLQLYFILSWLTVPFLWTSTPFPIFLHKDMLAKTCCHCTHKDGSFDILRTWWHVCVFGEPQQRAMSGFVLHSASLLGGINLSVLSEESGRWEWL